MKNIVCYLFLSTFLIVKITYHQDENHEILFPSFYSEINYSEGNENPFFFCIINNNQNNFFILNKNNNTFELKRKFIIYKVSATYNYLKLLHNSIHIKYYAENTWFLLQSNFFIEEYSIMPTVIEISEIEMENFNINNCLEINIKNLILSFQFYHFSEMNIYLGLLRSIDFYTIILNPIPINKDKDNSIQFYSDFLGRNFRKMMIFNNQKTESKPSIKIHYSNPIFLAILFFLLIFSCFLSKKIFQFSPKKVNK